MKRHVYVLERKKENNLTVEETNVTEDVKNCQLHRQYFCTRDP